MSGFHLDVRITMQASQDVQQSKAESKFQAPTCVAKQCYITGV